MPEMRKQFGVAGLPTVVLANQDGVEIDRTYGYINTADFITTMDNYAKGIGTLDAMLAEEDAKSGDNAFLMELGKKLYAHSRFDDADVRFAAVVRTDSTNADGLAAEAQLKRGLVAYKNDDPKLGMVFCQALLDRWPGSDKRAEATIYLAWYAEKAGENAQALTSYQDYLKNWPDGEDAEFAKEQVGKLTSGDGESEE